MTPSLTERPALACGDFQSGQALEGGHTACAAFQQSGPALAGEGLGGGGGGSGCTYWQGLAMFSEAQSSGSIAQYDAENACC